MRISRKYLFLAVVWVGTWWVTLFSTDTFLYASPKDYLHLLDLIEPQNNEAPLYVFNDFEENFDKESHTSCLEYFNGHPGLVKRIKKDLHARELQWRLDSLKQRLLFVPEKREAYALLFEAYCRDVIQYISNKTGLNNPYEKIETLRQERPEIPQSHVAAFLVNNLAKESLSTYAFTNHKNKTLLIELRGQIYVGETGSYTTNIILKDGGSFDFVKENYTIWQTSSKNPYDVLMLPFEETFHIVLREHTHRAIKEQLERHRIKDITEVKRIVGEWIAVEEALAGALAQALMQSFFEEYTGKISRSCLELTMESRREFKRYMYLEKGIQLVKNMGLQEALTLYSKDPKAFKMFLTL